MAISITYPFTTTGEYTKSDTLVSGGVALLDFQDDTGRTFTENFSSPTGFTYDSTKARIGNPEDATFLATYDTDANGTQGNGILTGTTVGGPSVSGGLLDLTGGTEKSVDYNADLNADSQQVGAVRFRWVPNYSGAPAVTQNLFIIQEANADESNQISFIHSITTGNLTLSCRDAAAVGFMTVSFGAWSPTSGQQYEFELNYDFTAGATRLFIDGTQFGSTQTSTGTRGSAIGLLRIGNDYNGGAISNFKVQDIQIFKTVQHTAGYTAVGPSLWTETKINRPSDSVFMVNFNSGASLNANWSTGTTTGTSVGGASASGGFLNLTGGGDRYIYYDGTGSVSTVTNQGCVEFSVKPTYSGSPASEKAMFRIANSSSGNFNLVELRHLVSGQLHLNMGDSAAILIVTTDIGAWAPVSGTEYVFSINWNLTGVLGTSAIRVFLDGTQIGSTYQTTGTRSTSAVTLRLGRSDGGINYWDGYFNWFEVFNAVQYTANHALPTEPVTYAESAVILPTFTDAGPGTIQGLTNLAATESGVPKYQIRVDGVKYYWTGAVWDVSDGTYTQANTKADINTNLAAFTTIDGETSLEMVIVLPSGGTLASVDSLVLTYTAQEYKASGTVYPISTVDAEDIESISITHTLPGSDNIKYGLRANSTLYWYNTVSTNWEASDGSTAQLNTKAEIEANASTFFDDLGANADIAPFAKLISNDGTTTPTLDSMTINYNYGAEEPTAPATCTVWGYLKDVFGNKLSGATVQVTLSKSDGEYFEAASHVILKKTLSTTTDANGYFELELIRSSEFENADVEYTLKITDSSGKKIEFLDGDTLEFSVPDQSSSNITTLITAV